MNANTGEIHILNESLTRKENAKQLGIKTRDLIPLGKLPDSDCRYCKGTGVAKIKASGRRIPCKCTILQPA